MGGNETEPLRAIDMGRILLDHGEAEDAAAAFTLALDDTSSTPSEMFEAAVRLLQCGGDYHAAYDALLTLCGASSAGGVPAVSTPDDGGPGDGGPAESGPAVGGPVIGGPAVGGPAFGGEEAGPLFADALAVLTEAFYLPNVEDLRRRYEANRALLADYPYLFRKDFPDFQDLPLQFYPYDDGVYIPFDGKRFLPRTEPGYEVVSRNFFQNLEQPVLAADVYSQYELAYLRDNVRRSEDVGRENHVYLHYTDWDVFCPWLQVLDMEPLLREAKLVFLFGDEVSQYPIDFKARFGIDYSRFSLKPVGIGEVTRLIWHTQLSSHNGGDFFNEIFDAHPNLVCLPTLMLSDAQEAVRMARDLLRTAKSPAQARKLFRHWDDPGLAEELYRMENPTDKDFLTAIYLGQEEWNRFRDRASRIAPALFFQPHFPSLIYALRLGEDGSAQTYSARAEEICASPLLQGFPYVKTFTPLRRWTTSFGGAMRFVRGLGRQEGLRLGIHEPLPDAITYRVMNRSFMADPANRLFRDSVIVRLEDGKLNPRATLPRLAAFLDLPYTPSMAYCSEKGVRDPNYTSDPEYAVGFSLASLNRDYSMYVNDSEAAFLEYSFRDAYRFYGYDFQWYDGGPMDGEKMNALLDGFTTQDRLLREDWEELSGYTLELDVGGETVEVRPDMPEEEREKLWKDHMSDICRTRRAVGRAMRLPLRFVSAEGRPLRMIPLLEPDPAQLDVPVYH